MPTAATQRPPAARRTQAERRASSRAKLLDAAVLALAQRGYAGASLPEVVRRAGLSNGGLWRYFQSKAELMAAAELHAEESLLAAVVHEPDPAPTPQARVDAAVDRMLEWARQPALQAIIELILASRSDPEVRAALEATDDRAAAIFFRAMRDLLGDELATHPHFEANVRQLGLVLYGVTLTDHLRPEWASEALAIELRAVTRRLFDL
ncbi:MAG TPA: helix-turn-helix domain-containing protein [Mycobacteriales bacterium]|nr:helix-turn-helix domain-containing protein [Mycobacteriales bacterium]